jgi:hypothetical protein
MRQTGIVNMKDLQSVAYNLGTAELCEASLQRHEQRSQPAARSLLKRACIPAARPKTNSPSTIRRPRPLFGGA